MALNQFEAYRHVYFVLPSLRGGGAEKVIVTLLRHFDRSRFRLSLIVLDMTNPVFGDEIPEDVEVINLKCHRVLYVVPSILRLLWSRRPHVVFSTLSHLNLALAIIRPILPPRTLYFARETSVVSQVISCYAWPGLWAWAYRRFYPQLDMLVCQSCYMRDDLVRGYSFPAQKIVVINNPVDVERVQQLSNINHTAAPTTHPTHIHLLAIGRLTREKGLDLLIEALAICHKPSLRLTILGDGPLLGDLEKLVLSKDLQNQVEFAGFQFNPYSYLRQSDALVLSSRYDGFPNVVLEAFACGIPVIATPSPGGVVEMLSDVPGCSIANNVSATSLAEAIVAFSKGTRVPASAVKPYEVATIVKRYEELLVCG